MKEKLNKKEKLAAFKFAVVVTLITIFFVVAFFTIFVNEYHSWVTHTKAREFKSVRLWIRSMKPAHINFN